ncbi:MAG: LysR family transcriptional regulator [Mycobacteriales bacterium]|nr:MAG: LysR family transcriptional regulator [Pseudonocardiales bacterium]
MELRQLVYFEAVARLGGFTRAAEQLHIAQPAISAQVRRLERELGVALLERTTRRVGLTHAGRLLLVRARVVLAELDGVRSDLDELGAVLRGALRLGVTQILGSVDLAGLLAAFHRRYPDVALAVRSGLVAELLGELAAGTVDAVIAPIHDDLPDRYLARPLTAERLTLVTAPAHLLAGPRTISLATVRDEPFVCLPAGSGLHAILTAAAAEQGFTPRIQFEAPDPASIRRFVAADLGVALLAESAAHGDGPAIDVHRLKPTPPHPPIGLIRHRGQPMSPTLRAWVQHVQRHHQTN